jgi:hypothetical protein
VCHANEHLKGTKRAEFLRYFTKKSKTLNDLEAVRRIFIESGTLDYSLNAIKTRMTDSQKILSKLTILPAYRDLIGDCLMRLFKQSDAMARQFNRPVQIIP